MNTTRLIRRALAYYRRTNVAVVLGAAVGTTVLCGALLVGDSMRASLRAAALGRLGRIDYVLSAPRFFREQLADALAGPHAGTTLTAPVVTLRGAATHADTQARAGGVHVLGVDRRFWRLADDDSLAAFDGPQPGQVVLNDVLARELDAAPGADIILRVAKPGDVSLESLLGRRDDATAGLRLRVARVVPASGLGGYSASPSQRPVLNAFVSIDELRRAVSRTNQVNAVVIHSETPDHHQLSAALRSAAALADYGLRMIANDKLGYVRFEADAFLLPPAAETAIREAAGAHGARISPVVAYLANSIGPTGDPDRLHTIAYSTVVAIDPAHTSLSLDAGRMLKPGDNNEVMLNAWTARQMNVTPGDTVEISYYVTGPLGALDTRTRKLTVVGIVAMTDAALDPGFTPAYKGVTDTRNLSDWDPPFPMDLKLIRDRDEDYWDTYRTAPKAFVGLETGLTMWAEHKPRLGRFTSIRVIPPDDDEVTDFAHQIEAAVLDRISPQRFGMALQPVRSVALAAGSGTTDFGGLFVGFSFFLIASAAMLVALLFRLSVERRSREVGMLLATGFAPNRTRRIFVAQGVLLACIGGVIGVAGAVGYAAMMITGLKTWWSAAVSTPFLTLAVGPDGIAIGLVAGTVIAAASIALSIRGLAHRPPAALLLGATGDDQRHRRRTRPILIVATIALLVAALGLAAYGTLLSGMAQAGTFFASGFAMLAMGLCGVGIHFDRQRRLHRDRPIAPSVVRIASRNVVRHTGRGLLTVGLIAAATFLLVAIDAFRLDASSTRGTGGFTLIAESAGPLPYDPGTVRGRTELGFQQPDDPALASVNIVPFRLRRGDQTSCLNLYVPANPRIIGAPPSSIPPGGFQFAGSLAATDADRANPWRLLDSELDDGAIPVIGDEAAVLWQLHSGLGKDLAITDQHGDPVRLRFVALLRNSILQDELIVSDANFVRLFPQIDGHAFFLIQTPPGDADRIESRLERELAPFGFDATRADVRLAQFMAVQNTYLSTFQTLGGIGLVLGTVGLAAVLLRNIWERRSELALMQALGFARTGIAWMVMAENLILVVLGLVVGVGSALVAIGPTVMRDPAAIPWGSIALTVTAVIVVSAGASLLAIRGALGAVQLAGLRHE